MIYLGQDPKVSKYAAKYVMAYFPGLVIFALMDLQKRYLNMMNQTFVPFVAKWIGIVFHILFNYYFVWKLDFGI